jgi:hypothetical protein
MNPGCSAPFRYLRDGRLFNLEIPVRPDGEGRACRVERFWLCGECASSLTVVLKDKSATVEPRYFELATGERVEQSETEEPFACGAFTGS